LYILLGYNLPICNQDKVIGEAYNDYHALLLLSLRNQIQLYISMLQSVFISAVEYFARLSISSDIICHGDF